MAAVAEPTIKVNEITWFTLMPTSMAMSLSWAVARMAFPIRVYLIRKVRQAITAAVTRIMTISGVPIMWAQGSIHSQSCIRAGKGRKSDVCASRT